MSGHTILLVEDRSGDWRQRQTDSPADGACGSAHYLASEVLGGAPRGDFCLVLMDLQISAHARAAKAISSRHSQALKAMVEFIRGASAENGAHYLPSWSSVAPIQRNRGDARSVRPATDDFLRSHLAPNRMPLATRFETGSHERTARITRPAPIAFARRHKPRQGAAPAMPGAARCAHPHHPYRRTRWATARASSCRGRSATVSNWTWTVLLGTQLGRVRGSVHAFHGDGRHAGSGFKAASGVYKDSRPTLAKRPFFSRTISPRWLALHAIVVIEEINFAARAHASLARVRALVDDLERVARNLPPRSHSSEALFPEHSGKSTPFSAACAERAALFRA